MASAQAAPPRPGEMKSIGGDRYQVGTIVVDKRARRFTVPGRVHLRDKPLEYLATTPGGKKAYETLFELDTTGSEFNLACILVGLERDPALGPVGRNPKSPLAGQRVAISVAWMESGKRRQVSAAEALLNPEAKVKPEVVEWIYAGAPSTDPNSPYIPDLKGTLIGCIGDPDCIIDSLRTIGLGAYGSVRGSAMLPPVDTPIELIVDAAPAPK